MVEIVTLHLLGPDGVKHFRDYRRTQTGIREDHFFRNGQDLKPEVATWLAYLERIALDGDSIDRGTMVVKILAIIKKMFSSTPQDRHSSIIVLRNLAHYMRGEEIPIDEIYASIDEGADYSHRETYSEEQPRTISDEVAVNGSGVDPQRSSLESLHNSEQVENIQEYLEIYFDSDHPVMRVLAPLSGRQGLS